MRFSARWVLAGSGLLRAAIGSALVARPAALPRALGVDTTTARNVSWLPVMVGARDLVLGAGLVDAVRRRSDPRPWLVAQAVCDAADAVALGVATARGRVTPAAGGVAAAVAGLGAAAEARALAELAGGRRRSGPRG